jgi:hypothetical protein
MARVATLVGALAVVGSVGCAVTEGDVKRWETTERGPEKLAAVVGHAKYKPELRVSAAEALIRMKARSGKRIGIDNLMATLAALSDGERAVVTTGLVPKLVEAMGAPRPPKNADGTWPPDPSVPFKDAAFGLVSHEPSLVGDEEGARQKLIAALAAWVQTDFENRVDIASQLFGIEQIARFIGPDAVKELPTLLDDRSTKLDRIASLVADVGSADTKEQASKRLVELASRVDSNDWLEKVGKEDVKKANEKNKYNASPEQFARQVELYRDQEFQKLFGSMKKVGGKQGAKFALDYASTGKKPSPFAFTLMPSDDGKPFWDGRVSGRRVAALASLEGHASTLKGAEADKLFEIARSDDTPDDVRDLAFARLGELPKKEVEKKLYSLFDNKRWKIRWVSAQVLLRGLDSAQIEEFLGRLPASPAVSFGMGEAFTYGDLIRKIEPKGAKAEKPMDILKRHLGPGPMGARLAALGAFYEGKIADIPLLKPFEGDKSPISKCREEDECGWVCELPVPGATDGSTVANNVTTIGDFVTFCVIPSMTSK